MVASIQSPSHSNAFFRLGRILQHQCQKHHEGTSILSLLRITFPSRSKQDHSQTTVNGIARFIYKEVNPNCIIILSLFTWSSCMLLYINIYMYTDQLQIWESTCSDRFPTKVASFKNINRGTTYERSCFPTTIAVSLPLQVDYMN